MKTIFDEMTTVSSAIMHHTKLPSGVCLSYLDIGEGPVLLFVPGWTFSGDVFSYQIADLSKDHRVIVLEPRSQGRSPLSEGGNDYDTHAADLEAFIQKMDLADIVLIGWSAGSAATWGYVRRAGVGKVRAHVCIDQPPKCLPDYEATDWSEGSIAEIAKAISRMTQPDQLRAFIREFVVDTFVERALDADELEWILAQSAATPQPIALSLFTFAMFGDYRNEATLLDQQRPSLFVVASRSAANALPYIRKNWPASEVLSFGGHLMFWEHHDRFNDALRQFVARTKADTKPAAQEHRSRRVV